MTSIVSWSTVTSGSNVTQSRDAGVPLSGTQFTQCPAVRKTPIDGAFLCVPAYEPEHAR